MMACQTMVILTTQPRHFIMKIILGKHIISQPSRRNSDVESNGEETSISMQPFSGYAVIYSCRVFLGANVARRLVKERLGVPLERRVTEPTNNAKGQKLGMERSIKSCTTLS
jgi:hypothetical protein